MLVVEDSPELRDILALALTFEDFHAVPAATAEDALRVLQAARFDFAVIDEHLPLMQGHELVQTIRAAPQWRAMGLIALTGDGAPQTALDLLLAGCDAFITKPAPLDDLRSVLRSLALGRTAEPTHTTDTERTSEAGEVAPELNRIVHEVVTAHPALGRLPEVLAIHGDAPDADGQLERYLLSADRGLVVRLYRAFGMPLPPPPVSLGRAIQEIGWRPVHSAAVATAVARELGRDPLHVLNGPAFWRNAAAVGVLAVLTATADGTFHDEAFAAGFLHRLGLLLLDQHAPKTLAGAIERARRDRLPLERAVADEAGFSLAELRRRHRASLATARLARGRVRLSCVDGRRPAGAAGAAEPRGALASRRRDARVRGGGRPRRAARVEPHVDRGAPAAGVGPRGRRSLVGTARGRRALRLDLRSWSLTPSPMTCGTTTELRYPGRSPAAVAGVPAVFSVLMVAVFGGAVAALTLAFVSRRGGAIPYGPFFAAGALLAMW